MIIQNTIKLIAWRDEGSPQSIMLDPNHAILVGKSCNCGLRLTGHEISDIHCSIGLEDGHIWVQDWMSTTGTRLNGEQIASKTQVGRDSIVEVGNYKIQMTEEEVTPEEAIPVDVEQESQAQTVEAQSCQSVACDSQPKNRVASPSSADESYAGPAERHLSDKPQRQDEERIGVKPCETQSEYAMGCDDEFFSEDSEHYDRATVELLQAEIEELRTALAERDAEHAYAFEFPAQVVAEAGESEHAIERMQELVEEVNRADERVMILEEMLHAAEDANRSEVEERAHLEAWVGDIETRVGQREQEHAAEAEALRERLGIADQKYAHLQRQLQQAATTGDNSQKRYEETMEHLQQDNGRLQESLAQAKKDLRQLQQKCENLSLATDVALREERAKVAKEHAEMSRLKFEYAQKIRDLEEGIPKSEAEVDPRIESLREHRRYLREMSEEKNRERQQHSLSSRLKRIWNHLE